MLYEFDYAVERWKKEAPSLYSYLEKYINMKPGTAISYFGWLDNFRFIGDLLEIIGEQAPECDWNNEDISCVFFAKGDLSEFDISIYESEKMFDDDPDFMIANYKGSLTKEQIKRIQELLQIHGHIEKTIFTGFCKYANCDFFDELSPEEYICMDKIKYKDTRNQP